MSDPGVRALIRRLVHPAESRTAVVRPPRRALLPVTPLNVPLLLLSVMLLVSLWATYSLPASAILVLLTVGGLLVYFGFAGWGARPGGWTICLGLFALSGIVVGAIGLLFTRRVDKIPWLHPVIERVPSPILAFPGFPQGIHPNFAGALLWMLPALLAFLAVLMLRAAAVRREYGLWPTVFSLGALAGTDLALLGLLIFLESRSAWFGLAVGLLGMLCLTLPSRWRMATLGLSALLLVSAAFAVGNAGEGFLSIDLVGSLAPEGRLELWSRAIYALQDFPFTGMGMNTFRRILPVLYPMFLVGPETDVVHAHNEFLNVGVDLGIPGLIAFLSLYIGSFWMLGSAWRRAGRPGFGPARFGRLAKVLGKRDYVRTVAAGLAGGLIAHLVFGLTDTIVLAGAYPFWMILGLSAALYHLSGPQGPSRHPVETPDGKSNAADLARTA